MKLQYTYLKVAFAAIWVTAVCTAGLLAHVTSLSTWAVLAAVAVLPPLVVMWFWRYPDKTTSESIREALR